MEENSLRLILLVVGAVVVLVIYFYDKWKKSEMQAEEEFGAGAASERADPLMDSNASFSAVFDDNKIVESAVEKIAVEDVAAEVESKLEEKLPEEPTALAEPGPVIQLVIQPFQSVAMQGDVLLKAFTELGLEFGEMDIFHYYERQGDVDVQQFHVANLLEPGVFPVGNMADFESTGLVLFFQESDSFKATASFDSMLAVAQQLSQMLGANLMGADMKELTLDKINALRLQLSELPR